MSEDFICAEERDDECVGEEYVDDPDTPGTLLSKFSEKSSGAQTKRGEKVVSCTLCKRSFQSYDGYRHHLQLHVAEDLYRSACGLDVAMDLCRFEAKLILLKMQSSEFKSALRQSVCHIATYLHSRTENSPLVFIDTLSEEIWCSIPPASMLEPSSLNSKFVCNVNCLLGDTDKRKEFLEKLLHEISDSDCVTDAEVLDWFIADFVSHLSDAIELLYLKALRRPRETLLAPDKTYSEEGEVSVQFKQTIHYIGGSAVKSVFRLALRFKGNVKWDNISACLCGRFISGDISSSVDKEVQKWTEARSRGGLIFITERCWSFLMALSGLLKKLGKSDGSLIHCEILSSIKNCDVLMFLWSDLVGQDLSDEENSTLLENLCRSFINTWGHGVALKRKNAIVGRQKDKVPLRSSLCNK